MGFWFGFAVLVQRLCIRVFFFFFFINTVYCFQYVLLLLCIDCISVLGIGFLYSDVTVGMVGKFDFWFCVVLFFFFFENPWVGLLCWACRGLGSVSFSFFSFIFFFLKVEQIIFGLALLHFYFIFFRF